VRVVGLVACLGGRPLMGVEFSRVFFGWGVVVGWVGVYRAS